MAEALGFDVRDTFSSSRQVESNHPVIPDRPLGPRGQEYKMRWAEVTVGKKITLGFGLVLALLLVAGVLSFTGVGGIVGNAREVISGNKLDAALAQKEVDHLNWMNAVNALLTDETVTELHVQTDPRKCGFGKWLYGDEAAEAVALVPSLAPLLKAIEDPHRKLHQSAIKIGEQFRPADENLPRISGGQGGRPPGLGR